MPDKVGAVLPVIRVDWQEVYPRVIYTALPRDVNKVCRTTDQVDLPIQTSHSKRRRTGPVRKCHLCKQTPQSEPDKIAYYKAKT